MTSSEPPVFVTPATEAVATPELEVIPGGSDDEGRMTLVEHLTDLRRVLIRSLIAFGAGSVVGVAASFWIVKFLAGPLTSEGLKPVILAPMGIFTVHLKVGLMVGIALALPVILRQVWWFVKPGLKPKERRFALPLMVSSLGLFALGAVLAYFFMYIAIRLLVGTAHLTGITYIPELNSYLGLVAILILAFGITFEFPVALVLMSMVGLVSSAKLRSWRRGAYFVIAAVGYFITPGVDPVTPLALIIPLLLLYEGSIFVIRRMKH